MTIIVYEAPTNCVHVDSRHSWDDGLIQHATKITRLQKECVGAYAGGLGGDVLLELVADLVGTSQRAQHLVLDEHLARACDGIEAFVRHQPSGKVFYARVERLCLIVIPAGTTTYAIGSGAAMFRALLASELRRGPHYSIVPDLVTDCLQRVCDIVPSCGGFIETF